MRNRVKTKTSMGAGLSLLDSITRAQGQALAEEKAATEDAWRGLFGQRHASKLISTSMNHFRTATTSK